ncbi:MAG: hypothetical protein ACFFAO_16250 [Candidatus Hermodarchaeota archaeon]
MGKEDKLRILAGVLLIISAITHVSQLFIFGFDWHQIVAAVYGAFYAILGILLIYLKNNKLLLLFISVVLIIGGTYGFIRFIIILTTENVFNYFNLFHVIVDIIVVPICLDLYLKFKKEN